MSCHNGIIGMSMSGKSTLAKIMARELKRKGRRVVVLDPMGDPQWKAVADVATKDPTLFLLLAQTNEKIHLFADEWGISVGPHAHDFDWLGTTARHHGHTVWVIAHRWQQISTTLRDNIGRAFLFGQGVHSAGLVSEEFAKRCLAADLPRLTTGNFIEVVRCRADLRRGTLDFKRKSLKWNRIRSAA